LWWKEERPSKKEHEVNKTMSVGGKKKTSEKEGIKPVLPP
jgi:hypothetical protein